MPSRIVQLSHQLGARQLGVKSQRRAMFTRLVSLSSPPPPPLSCGWTNKVTLPWGGPSGTGRLNFRLGCCTSSGYANLVLTVSSNIDAFPTYNPSDTDVLNFYEATGKYNPTIPGSDQGAIENECLAFGRDTGMAGWKLDSWCDIDPTNDVARRQSVSLFSGGYLGILLPLTAQDQVGKRWTVVDKSLTGASAPGSWGGHCVWVPLYYDPKMYGAITWGGLQEMDDAFINAYCVEWHIPLMQRWINRYGYTPAGYNLAQEEAYEQSLAA